MGDTISGSSGGPARRGRPGKPGSSVLTPPVGIPAVPSSSEAADTVKAPPVAPPALPKVIVAPCVCGHAREAHEHYRPGHDCGACGARGCADYRRVGGAVSRALRRLGVRH